MADGVKSPYRIIRNVTDSSLLFMPNMSTSSSTPGTNLLSTLLPPGAVKITYAYDCLGHSTDSVTPSMSGFAANRLMFLRALFPSICALRFRVLGLSVGGYIAQTLALDATVVIPRLILSGTGPRSTASNE
jgi:pimeloyl-ACP methyl ester carboxylesterase